jgi:hypothetical protein
MAIPANRGCRSPCRPVVASVAAKVSSAGNRAWLGNGCRTAARLRVGPPAPAVPHRQAQPRSPPGVRLGRRPSHGDGGGPEAPAYRKTSYEAASAFAGEPEVYRGAFVRLIVKSSASLASRWKLPPGQGTSGMGFNSSYPGWAPPTPHGSRLGETRHALSSTAAACRDQRFPLISSCMVSFSSSASASSRSRRSRPPASSGAWWHQPARQARAVACSDEGSSRPPSKSAALWLQPVSGACVQPGVRDGRNGLVGQAFSLEEVLA